MDSEKHGERTVHVLLREEKQHVDGYTTSSMVLVDVFETESDAERWLDSNIREPLHYEYEIEEREVKTSE